MKRSWKYFAAILAAIGLDQIIKLIVLNNMQVYETAFSLGGFQIKYIQNFGAAFGIFEDSRMFLIVMTSVTIIGAGLFMWRSFNEDGKMLMWALAMVIAGGIGNLIDRIYLGYVVDYLSFWSFPVFNFADMLVVCGAFLLFIYIFFIDGKTKE